MPIWVTQKISGTMRFVRIILAAAISLVWLNTGRGQTFGIYRELWTNLNAGAGNSLAAVPMNGGSFRPTYVGPRGGVYHYSASGNKVYEKHR